MSTAAERYREFHRKIAAMKARNATKGYSKKRKRKAKPAPSSSATAKSPVKDAESFVGEFFKKRKRRSSSGDGGGSVSVNRRKMRVGKTELAQHQRKWEKGRTVEPRELEEERGRQREVTNMSRGRGMKVPKVKRYKGRLKIGRAY